VNGSETRSCDKDNMEDVVFSCHKENTYSLYLLILIKVCKFGHIHATLYIDVKSSTFELVLHIICKSKPVK